MNQILEQSCMSFNRDRWPAEPGELLHGVYRGVIVPDSVRFLDKNKSLQTLVDVYMYDHMPALRGVPILTGKINSENGVWHDPEGLDIVAVAFLGGDIYDPVIVGYLPPRQDLEKPMQTPKQSYPSYHLHHQGTDILIDKDGNRIVTVAKDDTLTIKGDGKVVVEGALQIEVKTGNAAITIVEGDAEISAQNVNVTAKVKATVDTPLLECTGNVEVADTATANTIVDKIGSLDELRQEYLMHIHVDSIGGTTNPPSGR